MTFSPNDPCTHDSYCCCHWCTGGRLDDDPIPKCEDQDDFLRQPPQVETFGGMVMKAVQENIQGNAEALEHFTHTPYGNLIRGLDNYHVGAFNTLGNMLVTAMDMLRDQEAMPSHLASPRPDLMPVLMIEELPDGVKVAIISCSDYDAFSALPGGLEIGRDTYGKSGWNSDKNVAYYRTDVLMGISQ